MLVGRGRFLVMNLMKITRLKLAYQRFKFIRECNNQLEVLARRKKKKNVRSTKSLVPQISRTPPTSTPTPTHSSPTLDEVAIRRVIAEELRFKRKTTLVQTSSETLIERLVRRRRMMP